MNATKGNVFVCCLLSILAMLPFTGLASSAVGNTENRCQVMKLEVSRLPDLTIPRASHQLFYVNHEAVVAGGHTDGFVPTATAEYFKGGKWHVMKMVYNHDYGLSVVLKSGKVLLAGGCSEPIGIGQTFLAEIYDPVTHTFNASTCLDHKRAGASGLEIDSGRVVIAGNWYHDDGIEVFDGDRHFTYIKNVTVEHALPHLFRVDHDEVVLFGSLSTRGDTFVSATADRLNNDTLHIPLFDTWYPLVVPPHRDGESFIGDESKGVYAYLFPVRNDAGQVALAKVENGVFSLLPTVCPIPMKSSMGGIIYYSAVIVDRQRGIAFLMGTNSDYQIHPEKGFRTYVLRIDYAQATKGKGAPLTLYYTDPLPITPDYTPVLTDEGDILIAGGLTTEVSNFAPSGNVYLLRTGYPSAPVASAKNWWIGLLALIGLAIVTVLVYKRWRRKAVSQMDETVIERIDDPIPSVAPAPYADDSSADHELLRRICDLMEEQQLYLNVNLKLRDVAIALGSNRTSISNCINNLRGCSFSQFINIYRINHALELMRSQSDVRINEVWRASGFSNESSFFRSFKSVTGMTPSDWKSQTD